MTAIDTTVSLSTAQLAALRGAGVTAVSRYIAPQSWKRITPTEAARYAQVGMGLMLNWESGAEDLHLLSSADTATYARQAVAQAQACGYPSGRAIYVSADWNVTSSQWATMAARLRTIRPIYAAAGYRLGLYAPYDALGWAKRDSLVDYFWQAGMSTSWSSGRNAAAWPGAHLRQRRSTTLAGVDCDINDILISDFGQWRSAVLDATTGGDVSLTDPIPGTGTPDAHRQDRSGNEVLHDLWWSLGAAGFSDWQTEQLRNTRAILAGQAASQKREEATLAALTALSAGGTSVDTAAIVAHIDQVAAAESQTVAALSAQVADLTHRLAAAEQAAATALAG